ncbi:hypothetical protein BACPU_20750 [Bacillus pumilus]|nr:hypothetical protein BACPU_20750 [Bacillus pumilus]
MSTTIVAIVSIVLWIAVTNELGKSSKEKSRRKLFTFMLAGSLTTLILTLSLFQKLILKMI